MRKNLGRKTFLMFAVIALSLILLQAGSVSSAEPQVGAARGGVSVWHEVTGVGRLNITPEIAKVGETVLYEYTNYTSFSQGLNITLRFKNDQGYIGAVEVLRNVQKPKTVYNISVEQLFNPANSSYYNLTTVNTSTTTITVMEWVNVPAIRYVTGNDYYYTTQFFIGEQIRYKPKARTYGGLIKYDAVLHPSTLSPTQSIRVEIDPILNATAANITSNDDLNLTGKCQPNCARFVDGKIVGAAGNKSNLTGWETWSDNELLNNPTWNLFNMSNFPYTNNMESVRADQGFLNLTTRTDTTSGTIWTSAMRKINISMPSSGIIVDFWVKPIGAAGNTWHPMFCFDFTYDKVANGTSFVECNMPNAGSGVIAFYYESAANQYRLQKKDGGSMVTIASVEKQSGRDWEHWTVWINKTHAAAAVNFTEGGGTSLGVTAHNIAANGGGSGAASFDIYHGIIDDYRSALYDNISISNATDFRQPFNLTPAVLETNVMNSTITATTVKVSNQSSYYALGSGASFQVFDANHANTQTVTEGSFNTINSITGIGVNATLTPSDIKTASELTSILLEWSAAGGGPSNANEAEGDIAIEAGINSSTPTATKYPAQQVYVRNLSNNQTLGTFDWAAAFGNQRWLFNYVTTGESYVKAPNLTTAVYVLEITDKTSAAITDEVSRHINSTKS